MRLAATASMVLVVSGCTVISGQGDESSDSSSTLPTSSTSTTAVEISTTAVETSSATEVTPVNDAEPNLGFDIGSIAEVVRVSDQVWVRFNRYQQYGSGLAGPDFLEEPRYEASTDLGYIDENPRLRSYLLAPSTEILLMEASSFEQSCKSADGNVDFVQSSLTDLLTADSHNLVSLTFDDEARVVRVRDQRTC